MKKRYFTYLIVLTCLLVTFQVAAQKHSKGSQKTHSCTHTSCKDHNSCDRDKTCKSDSYSSEILKEEKISETCTAYEIKVSYDGTRTQGLSHYSIAIPCGEVKNLSNSENWKMVFGKDRTTGVYGLKVDDISGFGERKADSFTIKFTWCSSSSCTRELGVVAYKFGRCVSYDTLSSEDPEPPQTCSTLLASLQKKNVTCYAGNNGELQVTIQEGQEPFVYSWSNGSSSAIAQNLVAGQYAVTVKDANGNTLTLKEEISSPPPIAITESVLNPTCSGAGNGSIELIVAGGRGRYTYAWSNGSSTQNINNLTGGLYTVNVTDSIGCSAQKTFMLTNGALLTVGSSLRHPSCTQADGSIDITPSGGVAPYKYLWNTGAITEDLQNAGAGTHSVKIIDALGCSVDKTFTLRINNTLALTYVVTPTSCLGDTSGAINLSISGGTAPYTIQWLDGPTTEDRSGMTAGNYKVTVTDASGCSTQLTISVFKKPLQVSSTVNQPTCSGNLGSISLTPPTNGIPPYTYTWSNGATGNAIDGLTNGIYSVTVTDGSGCSTTLLFGIITPAAIEVTSVVNNTQCGNEGSFAIDLTVMGGKFPYSYLWSTGATTEDISGLNAGTYAVDIKDAFGCVVKKQFVVSPVSVNWTCLITPPATPVVCKSAGNILTTVVVGATAYQWTVSSSDNSWSISSGSSDSSAVYTAGNPGSSATFTLTIIKNGCTQTCSYTTVANGCVVRDNTGGGDPTSGDPCTTPPTNPPVVVEPEQPEEPAEEPGHGCKPNTVHVYPNPFSDKVKFEWTAPTNDRVRLEIFNAHGNRVSVVYEGAVIAGKRYSFDWSVIGCGKDRYYYFRYTSSKGVQHEKLVRR